MMAPEAAGRSNNFNLLRLLLASSVIIAHSPELIDGDRHRELAARIFGLWVTLGVLAVDGFFLLSGYLIAQSWDRSPKLFGYIAKRATRIYPGFVAACLVSGFLVGPLGGNPHYWREFHPIHFVGGLVKLEMPRLPDAFVDLPMKTVNSPLWTIRYEFAAYLGLALIGVLGLLKRRWLVLAGTVAVVIWSTAQVLALIPPIPPQKIIAYYDVEIPRLASCFLAGSCYYLFRDRIRYNAMAVLIAAGLLVSSLFHEALAAVAIPLFGGYVLVAVGLAPPIRATGLVRREDVSYGVYLYAWPIQQLLVDRWHSINPWLLSVATIPLALLAGWLSWRLVEQPFLRLGRSRRPAS